MSKINVNPRSPSPLICFGYAPGANSHVDSLMSPLGVGEIECSMSNYDALIGKSGHAQKGIVHLALPCSYYMAC